MERINPSNAGLEYHKKRFAFLAEEVQETQQALEANNLVEYIDGNADVIVIAANNIYHALRDKGLNILQAEQATKDFLTEVFESNLSKLIDGKAIFNEVGKVQKPETYFKPRIKEMLDYLNIDNPCQIA